LLKAVLKCCFILGVSFNQPRFSPCALWNPNAITYLDDSDVSLAYSIFIDTNNSLYVASYGLGKMFQFSLTSSTLMRTISDGVSHPYSVFVTTDQNVYINNYGYGNAVGKWTPGATIGTLVMNGTSACYSIFIDINSTLYCSLDASHTVISMSLAVGISSIITVAGTGIAGPTAAQLYAPNGLYIDTHFNLYVADSGNSRIQFFKFHQLNGTTVAGNGTSGSISLMHPTGVALDADDYLFIVDNGNHRIIGSGPLGFRCIVGCSGQSGLSASLLNFPRSLAFDTDGNLFVADSINHRIQKFLLTSNSCSKSTHLRKETYVSERV
jgi:NHL repeat